MGSTKAYIDGGRPKCRLEECSFGNFATDAMASEMGVDIALLNSGGIKGSFEHGKIFQMFIQPISNNYQKLAVTFQALMSTTI